MTFLPIVERELRLATRRRSTYWLRVVAAGVALIIGGGMLVLTLIPFAGPMPGSVLFTTLTWMALGAALSAGLFFTSDCLSEEKREGTLGFLFLTDLRGYDVVLGKLVATSLRSVFPLLSLFPILATTLLIGGVEVGHFWRSILAIANAAFFSLATGMFVSSISRHALRALAGTLFLLILMLGFGPLVDGLWSFVHGRFVPRLSLVSPGFAFASSNYAKAFWPPLLVSHWIAWLLLALSCLLVRRTWQEKAVSVRVRPPSMRPLGQPLPSSPALSRLLERNPVAWLAARDRGSSVVLWILFSTMATGFLVLLLTDAPSMIWHMSSWVSYLFSFTLYLWVTAKACQLFAEMRRSGALELLLASPLNSQQTVQGAWQGLLRLFAVPTLLLVGLQIGALVMTQTDLWRQMDFAWVQTLGIVAGGLAQVLNLIALAWFGLWMGLTSRNTLTATLKTFAFVYLIPLLAIYFITLMVAPLLMLISGWLSGANTPNQSVVAFWFPLHLFLAPPALAALKDFLFWFIARRKLLRQFRELAARSVVPPQPTLPPVINPAR